MTEEIIIDDIQVSKCRHFKYDGIKKPICRSGGCIAVYKSCLCKDNADCDYKQLKRLEQERDELKKTVENQKLEYEELQCDLSEVENACGCYQSKNAELKQENKSLYEEKNCLHKIIDRLLENAGYSKDIASAEDFEDVYEDMQRKINELAELEQENKELKVVKEQLKKWNDENLKRQDDMQLWIDLAEEQRKNYRSALEEIRANIQNWINSPWFCFNCRNNMDERLTEIKNKINEVLDE